MGLLRLWLALAVVEAHASATPFTLGGRLAVQCFYMISGFYMALVLSGKYRSSFWIFIFNRTLRLYPAYLASLALAAAVAWYWGVVLGHLNGTVGYYRVLWPHLSAAGKALAVAGNLGIEGKDLFVFLLVGHQDGRFHFSAQALQDANSAVNLLFIPQSWTLGLEFTFYLAAPFLLRLRSAWLLALAGASLLLRLLLASRGWGDDPWTYRFFPSELLFFLGGALAHRAYQARESSPFAARLSRTALMLFVPFLLLGPLAVRPFQALAVALPALLFLALPALFEFSRDRRLDRLLGELSYPVYLCHLAVRDVVNLALPQRFWFAGTVVLSLAVAAAIHRYLEAPADAWRARKTAQWLR